MPATVWSVDADTAPLAIGTSAFAVPIRPNTIRMQAVAATSAMKKVARLSLAFRLLLASSLSRNIFSSPGSRPIGLLPLMSPEETRISAPPGLNCGGPGQLLWQDRGDGQKPVSEGFRPNKCTYCAV